MEENQKAKIDINLKSINRELVEHRDCAFHMDPKDVIDVLRKQFPSQYLFTRELVQNSMDADSTRIDVYYKYDKQKKMLAISFEDDGRGMTNRDREELLLDLFTSNKKNNNETEGKYGIGFTSVFGIEPDYVVVESSKDGENWKLVINDKFEKAVVKNGERKGTAVTIIKNIEPDSVSYVVHETINALDDYCGFLQTPLFVKGRRINKQFDISSPIKVKFEGNGIYGVIGQSNESYIQYLSHRIKAEDFFGSWGIEKAIGKEISGLTVFVNDDYFDKVLSRNKVKRNEEFYKVAQVLRNAEKILTIGVLNELDPTNRKKIRTPNDGIKYSLVVGRKNFEIFSPLKGSEINGLIENIELEEDYSTTISKYGKIRLTSVSRRKKEESESSEGSQRPSSFRFSPKYGVLMKGQVFDSFDKKGMPICTLSNEKDYQDTDISAYDREGILSVEWDIKTRDKKARILLPPQYRIDIDTLQLKNQNIKDVLETIYEDEGGNTFIKLKEDIEDTVSYTAAPVEEIEQDYAKIKEHYTKLPFKINFPKEVREYVDEIKDFPDKEKAKLAEMFFESYLEYVDTYESSKEFEAFERGETAEKNIVDFVLNHRIANCGVSNTPFVAVLRNLGIPARLGTGYAGENGRLTAQHAYTEVYFPDTGWITMDSTPQRRSEGKYDLDIIDEDVDPIKSKKNHEKLENIEVEVEYKSRDPLKKNYNFSRKLYGESEMADSLLSREAYNILRKFESKSDKYFEQKYKYRDKEISEDYWQVIANSVKNGNMDKEVYNRPIFRTILKEKKSLNDILRSAISKKCVLIASENSDFAKKIAERGNLVVDDENKYIRKIIEYASSYWNTKIVSLDDYIEEPNVIIGNFENAPKDTKLDKKYKRFLEQLNSFMEREGYSDIFGKVFFGRFKNNEEDYTKKPSIFYDFSNVPEVRSKNGIRPLKYVALNADNPVVQELVEYSNKNPLGAVVSAMTMISYGADFSSEYKSDIIESATYHALDYFNGENFKGEI